MDTHLTGSGTLGEAKSPVAWSLVSYEENPRSFREESSERLRFEPHSTPPFSGSTAHRFPLRSRNCGLALGGETLSNINPSERGPEPQSHRVRGIYEVMRELQAGTSWRRFSAFDGIQIITSRVRSGTHHPGSGRPTEKFQGGYFTLTGERQRRAEMTAFEGI